MSTGTVEELLAYTKRAIALTRRIRSAKSRKVPGAVRAIEKLKNHLLRQRAYTKSDARKLQTAVDLAHKEWDRLLALYVDYEWAKQRADFAKKCACK